MCNWTLAPAGKRECGNCSCEPGSSRPVAQQLHLLQPSFSGSILLGTTDRWIHELQDTRDCAYIYLPRKNEGISHEPGEPAAVPGLAKAVGVGDFVPKEVVPEPPRAPVGQAAPKVGVGVQPPLELLPSGGVGPLPKAVQHPAHVEHTHLHMEKRMSAGNSSQTATKGGQGPCIAWGRGNKPRHCKPRMPPRAVQRGSAPPLAAAAAGCAAAGRSAQAAPAGGCGCPRGATCHPSRRPCQTPAGESPDYHLQQSQEWGRLHHASQLAVALSQTPSHAAPQRPRPPGRL